jgi:hypothetical protein
MKIEAFVDDFVLATFLIYSPLEHSATNLSIEPPAGQVLMAIGCLSREGKQRAIMRCCHILRCSPEVSHLSSSPQAVPTRSEGAAQGLGVERGKVATAPVYVRLMELFRPT